MDLTLFGGDVCDFHPSTGGGWKAEVFPKRGRIRLPESAPTRTLSQWERGSKEPRWDGS